MASFWSGPSVEKIMDGSINLTSDTIKVGLSTSTHVPNKDDAFLDTGGANDFSSGEIAVTGYTGGFNGAGRKTLANKVTTYESANDRTIWDADDVTWTALGAGATIAWATVMKEITNDAASPFILASDVPDTATNGGDIPLVWPASGIGYSSV